MKPLVYPRTIDNGAGELITFLRRVPGTDRLEAENVVAPGAGPPMHLHHRLTEAFTVKEGRLGYQRGSEPPQFAGPGEAVVFEPGVPHRFWNAGDVDLRCTGYVEPADNVEYLLTAIFESARQRGGGRPDLFDAAFLLRRYRGEYAMMEVPTLVQRLVFPVIAAIGRLLGKYKNYRDAPDPNIS